MNNLSRSEYDNLNTIFKSKATELEEFYKDQLEAENVHLPLATNFAWGETLVGTISGSPAETLPDWVKELLRKAWNDSLTEYFEQRDNEK